MLYIIFITPINKEHFIEQSNKEHIISVVNKRGIKQTFICTSFKHIQEKGTLYRYYYWIILSNIGIHIEVELELCTNVRWYMWIWVRVWVCVCASTDVRQGVCSNLPLLSDAIAFVYQFRLNKFNSTTTRDETVPVVYFIKIPRYAWFPVLPLVSYVYISYISILVHYNEMTSCL